jgi:hypothetical protein
VVAIKKIRLGKVKEVRPALETACSSPSRRGPGFAALFDLCRRHAGALGACECPRRLRGA